MACASGSTSAGATPLLLASSLILTWMQTWSGAMPAGRWADRRSAIFSRSMAWTQSKCSATGRVLLLCSGPMKCQVIRSRRSARAAILSRPSWT
ncbi:hypothetical protein D3C71_1822210 [compost metagenome]